jgi:hypothetical protein
MKPAVIMMNCRWVEQDAKELLSSVTACIEEVAKKLDQKNIQLDRIKVESMDIKSKRTAYWYALEFCLQWNTNFPRVKETKETIRLTAPILYPVRPTRMCSKHPPT